MMPWPAQGEAKTVLCVTTLGWPGAYAPLTESGELLVDGTCPSCHKRLTDSERQEYRSS